MKRPNTKRIALSGLLAAAALVLLLLAAVVPSGWMGVTALAGLSVAVAVSAMGYRSGISVYIVSGLLGLLLLPSKRAALLYLVLFGCYPILKNLFERLKPLALRLICKLAFFNLVVLGLYFFAGALMGELFTMDLAVPTWLVLMAAGSAVFLLYDIAFTKVMSLLQARLIPPLQRNFRGG